ncbi:MAG: P1 family peptidase [Chloroflexi bacterium]|nr:P1 family peptidase [Chloroflexota bacterium]
MLGGATNCWSPAYRWARSTDLRPISSSGHTLSSSIIILVAQPPTRLFARRPAQAAGAASRGHGLRPAPPPKKKRAPASTKAHHHHSGDIFLAFSRPASSRPQFTIWGSMLYGRAQCLHPIYFRCGSLCHGEAIINALVAAETMTGINGATPHARCRTRPFASHPAAAQGAAAGRIG